MSTTPRSVSPVKTLQSSADETEEHSMMVEPPTHLEEPTQPLEEVTVRLHPQTQVQAQAQSPKRTQASSYDAQHVAAHLRDQERFRQNKTPEPQKRQSNRSELQSPGHLAPFDWEDFEYRYEKALQEADEEEGKLLEEFEYLVKYFNVWASSSSIHDNERAVKRLQTRERFVRINEQTLLQKKQHLTEVVKAFQSALALLKATSA